MQKPTRRQQAQPWDFEGGGGKGGTREGGHWEGRVPLSPMQPHLSCTRHKRPSLMEDVYQVALQVTVWCVL